MKGRIFTVGLTGGIGSGKSTVLEMFRQCGAITLEADRLAHAELARPAIQEKLMAAFGPEVVQAGQVQRSVLARIVFHDPERLAELNALIHPGVRQALREFQAGLPDGSLLVYEVPLLFEAGLEGDFDRTITVWAPEALRAERARARSGWNQADWEAREARQLSLNEKAKRADLVIENTGNKEDLEEKVRTIYNNLSRSTQ